MPRRHLKNIKQAADLVASQSHVNELPPTTADTPMLSHTAAL